MSSRLEMRAHFDNPDKMPLTMTLTMPLADWKLLVIQMAPGGTSFPAQQIKDKIRCLVARAEIEIGSDGAGEQ
ncbi:MAG: hypothetical protein WC683_10020 [bacterium]